MSNPFAALDFEASLRRHGALLEMADVLSRHHHPSDLFAALAPNLLSAVQFDFLNFVVADASSQKVRLYIWDGGIWPTKPREVRVEESAAGWVWEHQTPLVINDLQHEPRFAEGLAWLYDYGLASYCVLPLSTPLTRIGALGFGSKMRDTFSEEHVRYLGRVATIVALCVDTAMTLSSADAEKMRVQQLLLEAGALGSKSQGISYSPGDGSVPSNPGDIRWSHKFGEPVSFSWPEALDRQEELLAAYFGASTVGLCVVDDGLRYLAINSALANMNGIPARDHLGMTVREVLGELAGPLEAELRRVLTTGQPVLNYEFSARLPHRDKAGHWIIHFFPVRGENATVTRIGAVAVEVTKQKQLESSFRDLTGALKREKACLQTLLETSLLLSSNWDVDQIFPKISAILRRVLQHEGAFFSLYDEAKGVFQRRAFDFPLSRGIYPQSSPVTSGGPPALAMAVRRPLVFSFEQLATLQTGNSSEDSVRSLLQEGVRSLCCAPLQRPGGTLGALSLVSTRPDAFGPADLDLINQVAAQLAIALENARAAREVRDLKDRLAEEKRYLEGEIDTTLNFEEIVGESPALKKVLEQVATVARSDATVLILGETGTGKELIARAIHRIGSRQEKNFIKMNCAAIPSGLLESELFGHEKGAFTGAITQKVGRMELADKGTLFLDEVGDVPLELQPKLLRVLQDQEFERLGSIHTIRVNVRLIAATNRDLAQSVATREFRSDLFYRLHVFPIMVPPLRERRSDIPILVRFFVKKFARRMDRHIESIPADTMNALLQWHWPGNIRELENFIERSVILSEGSVLRAPLAELMKSERDSVPENTLENAEREHIIRVLRECDGVISGPHGAARLLGVKRTTLQSKMLKLGITRNDYATRKSG